MSEIQPYKGLFSRKVIFGATLGGAVVFMITGVILWGGFNWAMEATNTIEFCITCHEMRDNVYAEYKGSIHDGNRSGVRAGCPDCHVPRPWVHKVIRKIKASNEIFHKLMGTVDTPEKFNEHRLEMAKRVWAAMKSTDSRECRNCHDWGTMNPEKQKPRARKQHKFAMENGNTCIDCHKGIAHKAVHDQLSDEELEKLNRPDPNYVRAVPQSFLDGLARAEAAEAAAEAERRAAAEKARKKKKAAKEAERKRIEEAVAKALAEYKANQAGTPTSGAAAPAATSGGIDWDDVPERLITLFYPGQASMEWVLRGRDHGGARPVKAGDRCFECHDKEVADMGRKIVTGEKLEPTPIPGKRGSIPVSVQAAHDGENLYMRFSWPNSEHAPAPFVEGGKMDPKNAVKLAMMFATDEVKYASQAGCWGTCHHDLRTMPHHPADPAAAGLPLDVSQGVTKYIAASRTKIEEKGRRGKKLGGWDKLKDADSLKAALEQGQFMDLLRYRSGDTAQDGHILEQRVMTGGQGVEFTGGLEGDTWVIVMKRPLKSTKPGDLSIEPGKLYNFGFAIHDDYANARFHHVSLGYKLGLDNEEAEINVVKREVAAAAPAGGTAAAAGAGFDVDWSKAGERTITLFYPGQASMEWVLRGRDHGGARPVKAGDRCFECHDKEVADMGQKIVTGEKAEPTPIPGKRGSIPVNVQATHDAENLYLRFQWEAAEHTPAPFVEGGKMDPDNEIKLAMMFATDEVKYASQAGCWGTCHHDLRTMPHHPADPAAAGLPLDVSQGVTKYIAASRTKIEEKGRRGKKLGGWDKLKDADSLKAEMEQHHYMDLVRCKSSGGTEDGHVLEQRVMSGGGSAECSVQRDGDTWTVEVKKKLNSGIAGDLPIEPGKLYNFGFAIHDDWTSARFHHVSLGYKLGLDNEEAEVNAMGQ